MNVRLRDKNCYNCAKRNSFNDTCNNIRSIFYHKPIKEIKKCDKFIPKNICLSCYFYSSDEKICKNRMSNHYKQKVGYFYLKTCDRKYDTGHIASAISDILNIDKKQSYSLMLYKLKKYLLIQDKNNQEYIDFYNNYGLILAQYLKEDDENKEYAQYLQQTYLLDTLTALKNNDFINGSKYFASMIYEMGYKYNILDEKCENILKRINKF